MAHRKGYCDAASRRQRMLDKARSDGEAAGRDALPFESPWCHLRAPVRNYWSPFITAWKQGYEIGMAQRIRSRRALPVE